MGAKRIVKDYADHLAELSTHDFCPWANRYVYWLKEPVGWFVLATIISVMVGAFLSPLGWTMAAGLFSLLLLGLGFPWLATRTVSCELTPTQRELHEGDQAFLELQVRNRLPLPVAGLSIEGYLSQPVGGNGALDETPVADVRLARVPALSRATFRLPIRPEYRGRYPIVRPRMACAFPFGIWTARREIQLVRSVTVWPLLIPISSEFEVAGAQMAEVGCGSRPTTHGDFFGVRGFRRGDTLKSIHWVQSAKLDSLVVCERGGPQQQPVEVRLSTTRGLGAAPQARENLAWRVRIAASLVDMLNARHLPVRLLIDDRQVSLSNGATARHEAWNALADIPLDPIAEPAVSHATNAVVPNSLASCIAITAQAANGSPLADGLVRVAIEQPRSGLRQLAQQDDSLINLDQDITSQLDRLMMEALRGNQAA